MEMKTWIQNNSKHTKHCMALAEGNYIASHLHSPQMLLRKLRETCDSTKDHDVPVCIFIVTWIAKKGGSHNSYYRAFMGWKFWGRSKRKVFSHNKAAITWNLNKRITYICLHLSREMARTLSPVMKPITTKEARSTPAADIGITDHEWQFAMQIADPSGRKKFSRQGRRSGLLVFRKRDVVWLLAKETENIVQNYRLWKLTNANSRTFHANLRQLWQSWNEHCNYYGVAKYSYLTSWCK